MRMRELKCAGCVDDSRYLCDMIPGVPRMEYCLLRCTVRIVFIDKTMLAAHCGIAG